ncbi:MAG: transglycosylase SLT domain-containing protein [Pseudoxanthomonas suwonensis]|nr:transglycosylase SLT domain-containing protein [Pseudoxanthomonas suwonensis]
MTFFAVPPAPIRRLPACSLLALALLLPSIDAHAQSRRDLANAAVIQQGFDAAVQQYKAALEAGNDEDAADTALEAMEQQIGACGAQRGCQLEPMLRSYREVLQADAGAADDPWFDEDDRVDITADDVPPSASADALLDERNRRFVQVVQFNPAVQAGIRRWLTDMRPQLMRSYENYQYLRHMMAPEFQKRGLPEALLFGILAKESNGMVHARSRAGAAGPMQFMPATGLRFGLGPDGTGFDTRFDAQRSAEAASAYLMERYRQLDSNIELSLAAYNGGEGRALRVFRETGGRSFWEYDVYNQFPAETRDYVPMVVAAAWIFLHPRDYGVRFPRVASRPGRITLQQDTTINELTICMGNNRGSDGFSRTLRNLNPRHASTSQWIPAGTQLKVTTQMARLYNSYCLRGRRAELARQLVLSDAATAVVRVGDLQPVSSVVAADGSTTSAATPAPVSAAPAPAAREHRVARGDTLSSIARRYDCTVSALARANDLQPPRYAIRPGQHLKLMGCRR